MEALASVFMPLGKHNDSVTGHTRTALADLQSFIKEIDQWLAPRRDNVRGLEVVLSDGRTIRTGTGAAKSAAVGKRK